MDRNPDNFDLVQQMKIFDIMLWLWFAEVGLINGAVFVMDMRGTVLGHMGKLNLVAIKKYAYYIQEALPIRLKAIHIINALPLIDRVLAMIKPFIKAEILALVHVHPKMDTFHKFIPKKLMPKDYDGDAPSNKELHGKFFN